MWLKTTVFCIDTIRSRQFWKRWIEQDTVGQWIIRNVRSAFQIGDFTFTERTIEFRGEIYSLGKNQFSKLFLREKVKEVKLAMPCFHHMHKYKLHVIWKRLDVSTTLHNESMHFVLLKINSRTSLMELLSLEHFHYQLSHLHFIQYC